MYVVWCLKGTFEPFNVQFIWYSRFVINAGGKFGWQVRISESPVDKFLDAEDKVREVMILASVKGVDP